MIGQKLIEQLHPRVLAFDASDFKPENIAIAKHADALVYVDRLGAADNVAAWQEAGREATEDQNTRVLIT